jgi:hypothetical protein
MQPYSAPSPVSQGNFRQEYDDYWHRATVNGAFRWLAEYSHWYGVASALSEIARIEQRPKKRGKKFEPSKEATPYAMRPCYDKLVLRWYMSYGVLRVSIRPKHSELYFLPASDVGEYKAVGREEWFGAGRHEQALEAAAQITTMAQRFFPRISVATRYCPCDACSHRLPYVSGSVCQPIGERWLCEGCVDRFSLMVPAPAMPAGKIKAAAEKERAKMTAGLRFSILERDGFACKVCKRGAYNGSDPVKLHVDHIHPIALGGKTEPANLQTLCQDCNLGKGAKRVAGMGQGVDGTIARD